MRPESAIDFDALARAHMPTLHAKALALTGNESDAWDLVQSTFEKALKSPPRVFSTDRACAWLLTILRNQFIDDWRSKKNRRNVPLSDDLIERLPVPAKEDPPAWHAISIECVEPMTAHLSQPLRAAFSYSTKGVPLAEIATRLQIPPSTVATRIFRGRRQMRRLLLDTAKAA